MGVEIPEDYLAQFKPKQPWQVFEEHPEWFYTDKHGKIKALQGAELAQKTTKYPRRMLHFGMTERTDAAASSESLERFKGLLHVLRQLNNTAGVKRRLENLCKSYEGQSALSTDEHDLYVPLLRFFSSHYRTLKNVLREPRPQEFHIEGAVTKGQVAELHRRADSAFYGQANAYLAAIGGVIEKRAARLKQDADAQEAAAQLARLRKDLADDTLSVSPKTKYSIDIAHLNHITKRPAGLKDDALTPTQARSTFRLEWFGFPYVLSKNPHRLNAGLNQSATNLLVNIVNCCIAGPYGKSKEASILYWLDPAVHTWEVSPGPYPAGLVLCVEATGNHASRPGDKEQYLVMEGFPANRHFYESISDVYPEQGFGIFTLAQLAYVLGLKTAQTQGIAKLFINTEHTGRQPSVEDAVLEAAKMTVQDCSAYRVKDGKFFLRKDPLTNAAFARVPAGNRAFGYTHFLEKKPLDPSLVSALRNDQSWDGEGYFDTWYGWNRFISETFAEWPSDLKRRHPYAGAVFERAQQRRSRGAHPESSWNLGVGYCRGIEVDVAKECARLNIR